jgi:hypothetical protein
VREQSGRYRANITKLLFAIIVAISAWPVLAAADALNQFLQRTAS